MDNKKSKYLRDGSESRSKYLRRESEYEEKKPEEEQESKKDYRESVITPKRARQQYLQELEREKIMPETEAEGLQSEPQNTLELKEENSAESEEENSQINPENEFENGEEKDENNRRFKGPKSNIGPSSNKRKRAAMRRAICIVILSFFAIILYFLRFHFPFTPDNFSVEFATIPELIASIAYGPLVGVAICLIKDIIHALIYNSNLISNLSNLLLDSVFVVIAGLLYSRSMFAGDRAVKPPEGYKRKDYRRRRIFKSSLIGALISLIPQFFITRYISFPLLERYYSSRGFSLEELLAKYQLGLMGIKHYLPESVNSLIPEISNISRGILFFNLPVSLFKMLVATIVTAIIYKFISSYLHYRDKK